MFGTKRSLVLLAVTACLRFPLPCGVVSAQESVPQPTRQAPVPSVVHLTLEESVQRAISVNKLLALGAMNVTSKGYATRVPALRRQQPAPPNGARIAPMLQGAVPGSSVVPFSVPRY
jgi:hypothetical protein